MGMSTILLIIIAANVIVSMKGFKDPAFFQRFMFQPQAILQNKQYDRLLTSGFLHVNTTHLLFNMLTLYFFAPVVIDFFGDIFKSKANGDIAFVIVYLLSVIGGNLLALYFQKDNPRYSAVGASGGVSGILFATIVVYPSLTLYLFFALPMPGWFFAIAYLGYSVYGMQKSLGNIGHEAHLGGAVTGLIAPLVVAPYLFQQNQIYIMGMMIPIIILFVLIMKTKR